MNGYKPTSACEMCKGDCCRALPGTAYPEDFNLPDTTRLTKALKSGNWCIDWWEGDPRLEKDEVEKGFFVRPAVKGKKGKLFDPGWGGECWFLSSKGCKLKFDKRPLGCRMLEPKGKSCLSHGYDKRHGALAWEKYWSVLEEFSK